MKKEGGRGGGGVSATPIQHSALLLGERSGNDETKTMSLYDCSLRIRYSFAGLRPKGGGGERGEKVWYSLRGPTVLRNLGGKQGGKLLYGFFGPLGMRVALSLLYYSGGETSKRKGYHDGLLPRVSGTRHY